MDTARHPTLQHRFADYVRDVRSPLNFRRFLCLRNPKNKKKIPKPFGAACFESLWATLVILRKNARPQNLTKGYNPAAFLERHDEHRQAGAVAFVRIAAGDQMPMPAHCPGFNAPGCFLATRVRHFWIDLAGSCELIFPSGILEDGDHREPQGSFLCSSPR